MRKIEHIYVHTLLVEVTSYLMEHEDVPANAFSPYLALDTRPSGIHRSKQEHEEAIRTLIGTIEIWLEHTRTDRPQTLDNRP